MRDLDQLEIGLVHRGLEALVTLPVAIGLLDDDAALGEQTLENRADIEFFVLGVTDAKRDILEIAEQRHADIIVGCGHEVHPERG